MPDDTCTVYLDGQKTYRIFENLFSNICKYAMPGSRVYVRVYERMGQYYAELKNMSAMELSVAAEELTERFVRGDASRNTEGSGLGLAIAKNLTQVQGGNFRIETDGDLFKVELGFPKLMYVEDRAAEEECEERRSVVDAEESGMQYAVGMEETGARKEMTETAEEGNGSEVSENDAPEPMEEETNKIDTF